jgi:hypothetical protein
MAIGYLAMRIDRDEEYDHEEYDDDYIHDQEPIPFKYKLMLIAVGIAILAGMVLDWMVENGL